MRIYALSMQGRAGSDIRDPSLRSGPRGKFRGNPSRILDRAHRVRRAAREWAASHRPTAMPRNHLRRIETGTSHRRHAASASGPGRFASRRDPAHPAPVLPRSRESRGKTVPVGHETSVPVRFPGDRGLGEFDAEESALKRWQVGHRMPEPSSRAPSAGMTRKGRSSVPLILTLAVLTLAGGFLGAGGSAGGFLGNPTTSMAGLTTAASGSVTV